MKKQTKEDLLAIRAAPCDRNVRKRILTNWDSIAKPLEGMGSFEKLTAQIGAIQGTEDVRIDKKAVIVMCADNGIVEEGISQSGPEVTLAVAKSMGRRRSSVSKMAAHVKADTIPIDIGIQCTETIPGVCDQKIRCGTRNFRKEPAMTEEEMLTAIFTGIESVRTCRENGYQILAVGEMGIGNTTTSSAVAAALLNCKAEEVTGRGAGLTDGKLKKKQQIIEEALNRYELRKADPFTVLQTVGGLDIAGLTGICIGGAVFRMPIILDGVISLSAAFLAKKLVPGSEQYLIASHTGREPAAKRLLSALSLHAVIDAELALGEGTGAVMLFSLLDLALCVYRERTTFKEIQIAPYKRC